MTWALLPLQLPCKATLPSQRLSLTATTLESAVQPQLQKHSKLTLPSQRCGWKAIALETVVQQRLQMRLKSTRFLQLWTFTTTTLEMLVQLRLQRRSKSTPHLQRCTWTTRTPFSTKKLQNQSLFFWRTTRHAPAMASLTKMVLHLQLLPAQQVHPQS